MAQHDYDIANQTFPSFRSDLNSVLEAINTSNSGTSRPSSAVAGTIWLDTTNSTNPTLKLYDGADDISLATFDYSANTVNWIDSTVVFDIVNDTTPQLGGNLDVNGNSLVSTANGNITFTPDGTGKVVISGLSFPTADGTSGQAIVTDGCGNLSFASVEGRTGTVNWDTTAKTASFTAVSGNGYFINTTSSAITLTLPASPSAGDIVAFKDYAFTFATNNLTVDGNNSPIGGVDGTINPTYNTNGTSKTFVYVDGTKGWLVVNESTDTSQESSASYIVATGGTITCCGDYKIHTFTSPGTFTVCSVGNPLGSDSVDYLVVAGGGGGGNKRAGGAGAGGLRIGAVTPSPSHSPLVTTGLPVSATGYPITVGGGGAGAGNPQGASGANSIFSTITSAGGGGGGNGDQNACGVAGGSGGGNGVDSGGPARTTGASGNTPPVSPPQGNPGGGTIPSTGGEGGGGGGGATTAGSPQPADRTGGPGGAGLNVSPVFGTAPQPFYQADVSNNGASAPGNFAGGGGGGGTPSGGPNANGGIGGGANGSYGTNPINNATANTGGGGGGGGCGPVAGTNGGSGIVIIRYKYQ